MSQPAFRLNSSPVPDPKFYRSQLKHSRAYAPPAPPPPPPFPDKPGCVLDLVVRGANTETVLEKSPS